MYYLDSISNLTHYDGTPKPGTTGGFVAGVWVRGLFTSFLGSAVALLQNFDDVAGDAGWSIRATEVASAPGSVDVTAVFGDTGGGGTVTLTARLPFTGRDNLIAVRLAAGLPELWINGVREDVGAFATAYNPGGGVYQLGFETGQATPVGVTFRGCFFSNTALSDSVWQSSYDGSINAGRWIADDVAGGQTATEFDNSWSAGELNSGDPELTGLAALPTWAPDGGSESLATPGGTSGHLRVAVPNYS